jgi:glycosyltransferase involved in cell wall biosynthesis
VIDSWLPTSRACLRSLGGRRSPSYAGAIRCGADGDDRQSVLRRVARVMSVAPVRRLLGASGRRLRARHRVVFISGEPSLWAGVRYRILNIASALPPRFFESVIIRLGELPERLGELDRVDVLWVWRSPYWDVLAEAIDTARAAGAAIVCDVDDLVFRPELARPDVVDALRTLNVAPEDLARHYADVRKLLLEADHCTVPTAPLARELEVLGLPTTVVPNGFDADFFRVAERARSGQRAGAQSVVRVGYAAGTFTHQRDLAVAAPALAQVLRDNKNVRFVTTKAVDIAEFPDLASMAAQVEQRELVPFDLLPFEYARFQVNIAPLEVGNPFCEAKSEVKYLEAALVGVGTVASPTEPFSAAIRHGETGFLATDDDSWYDALSLLVSDERIRNELGVSAHPPRRSDPIRAGVSRARREHAAQAAPKQRNPAAVGAGRLHEPATAGVEPVIAQGVAPGSLMRTGRGRRGPSHPSTAPHRPLRNRRPQSSGAGPMP